MLALADLNRGSSGRKWSQ